MVGCVGKAIPLCTLALGACATTICAAAPGTVVMVPLVPASDPVVAVTVVAVPETECVVSVMVAAPPAFVVETSVAPPGKEPLGSDLVHVTLMPCCATG